MLAGFVIDLAFIGANGISREHGLTTPDPAVSEVKAQAMRAVAAHASSRACTRSSARSSFCRFAEVGDLEAIVTSHRPARPRGPPLLTAAAPSHQSLTPVRVPDHRPRIAA